MLLSPPTPPVQFNKIKVGDAKSGNVPTPWAEAPTMESLIAQFGDFHFRAGSGSPAGAGRDTRGVPVVTRSNSNVDGSVGT